MRTTKRPEDISTSYGDLSGRMFHQGTNVGKADFVPPNHGSSFRSTRPVGAARLELDSSRRVTVVGADLARFNMSAS